MPMCRSNSKSSLTCLFMPLNKRKFLSHLSTFRPDGICACSNSRESSDFIHMVRIHIKGQYINFFVVQHSGLTTMCGLTIIALSIYHQVKSTNQLDQNQVFGLINTRPTIRCAQLGIHCPILFATPINPSYDDEFYLSFYVHSLSRHCDIEIDQLLISTISHPVVIPPPHYIEKANQNNKLLTCSSRGPVLSQTF